MSENPGKPPEKPLKPREQVFVDSVLAGNSNSQAARDAGYTEGSSRSKGMQLSRLPHIQAAVAAGLEIIKEKGRYNLELAMKDAIRAYEVAEQTKNANAMVKAGELKAKLNGLLIERQFLQVETVDMRAALSEALGRVRKVEETNSLELQAFTHARVLNTSQVETNAIPADIMDVIAEPYDKPE